MPASGPGWLPCWPCGRPAANSTSGGEDSAGQVRIVVRNGGTCVFGVGSWAAPGSDRPCCAGRRPTLEENPDEADPETAEEDLKKTCHSHEGEEDPPEEDPVF